MDDDAMPDTSLAKAQIINLDAPGSKSISCMFNPKEYSFAKQNNWTLGTATGANMPPIEFGGGQPATMQMQLFFDTYAEGRDVRADYTDAIWQLMMVDNSLRDPKTSKGRPPKVRFQWGAAWSFDAVITSVTQSFTLFLSDGTPVRATLDVAFQQIVDGFQNMRESRPHRHQNPTSGGDWSGRLWTVHEGDTLAWIAYKEYGDATQWRRIAQANRLREVRQLRPGTVLEIPHG